MGRRVLLLGLFGLLGLVGVLGMVSGSAAGTPPAVGWSHAVEVPGTAALNSGGNASVFSVSCGAARHCTAGGFYKDGSGHTQAFVVSETRGIWGARGRGAGHRCAQQRRHRDGGVGLVCRGRRLCGRRLLQGRLREPPGVRGQ